MKKLLIFTMLCSFLGACQQYSGPRHNAVVRIKYSKNTVANNRQTVSNSNYVSITQNPWQYMNNQINVNVPENSRIKAERERLLRDPQGFETIALRSEPYVYYIINQLRKNNLPVELALVPLIESAYDPLATSSAQAAGLWQFVPITAKEYGLKQSHYFDARRDLIASTSSAISLLQNLNERFNGDWLLTLAAYNAGEGRVRKAIEKNQARGLSTDYWSLELPNETMHYVPKILAIVDIVKNNARYGVKLPDCNYENSLVRIDITKNISLAKIAKYTGLSLNELTTYNAGYVQQTLNGPFHLLVPHTHAKSLYQKLQAENLVANEITELLQDIPHAPMPFEVKSSAIQHSDLSNKTVSSIVENNSNNTQITYQVKAGDNLYSIAQNYRVKITDLLLWNKLKNQRVKEGDVLTINLVNANPI
ncbi:transglycosylase SLT domain-containing protein [Gilliamella sp. B2776]|uniref:transglycosylase SLT domain-containing protein n=1 Tax=unclassified Gilliamella TaxID=2685620 RepID=UPI002269FEDC|nr:MULTISPECIES: transglycosylase SLT domain-containing protein [unclassified Gilliamella]MCX8650847.1 transglycosylase SLT domain-containing protein [Gilliamella sp. B2779]MCX8653973.1 transglycosylase SLT domain-containing protein [Gilliamella sp. B2737]MCX8657263.1 transglycosylase SLT domain-containing protein [Gilliamella sp. B2894]MCX8665897.1 transglycosylase SLT domain-containing protein [Gilliamella sp. B2887]MCX8691474.1 transglycosylase SLT domain-containing protein [Gilliamella sp.